MLAVGDTIPNWSAPGIRGGTVSWSQFDGSPTLLDIWTPWCPHCQADAPTLQRVAKDYPGREDGDGWDLAGQAADTHRY
jgi:thiol-disulfide isomerase/thioredoxin